MAAVQSQLLCRLDSEPVFIFFENIAGAPEQICGSICIRRSRSGISPSAPRTMKTGGALVHCIPQRARAKPKPKSQEAQERRSEC